MNGLNLNNVLDGIELMQRDFDKRNLNSGGKYSKNMRIKSE